MELSKLDLYECTGDLHFIGEIIKKYNILGFYTFTSQPSRTSIYSNGVERKQRAYIRGYMKKDMSQYIINELSHMYFIRDELNNKVLDEIYCNCGSVIFIDGKPGTMDFNFGDFEQSFNFSLPLRRPYDEYHMLCDTIPKNLISDEITEFDILCLDWNNNDMWLKLLEVIEKYITL